MNINQRFMHLVEKVSTSKAAFSKATGISSVILSHIGSGRNKVSLTAVIQLLENYPNINAEYLLLGKGPAFKSSDSDKLNNLLQSINSIKDTANSQNKTLIRQIESVVNQISTD